MRTTLLRQQLVWAIQPELGMPLSGVEERMLVARPAELVQRSRRYFIGRGLCGPHVGALGLAAGAFCQTYAPFSVDTATVPASTNKKGSQGLISEFSSTDLCALPRE